MREPRARARDTRTRPRHANHVQELEPMSDKMDAQLKRASPVLPTPYGLTLATHRLEGDVADMSIPISAPRPLDEAPDIQRLQSSAIEFLGLVQADLAEVEERREQYRRLRSHYVQLARRYGVSYERIAVALGVSGSAVRKMIERAN